jgi:hypothetical protein
MISNCDDVRGMLPWLLNGTLDDDERRQVLAHLATCETCHQDLADTRLAAEIFDQHPPAETILALAWDETPHGIDPTLLEEHLASCPRCAAELELARMSRRLEEDERVVPLPWRTTPAPAPAPAKTTGWRGWKSAALAAGLAGVVASAGWFQTAGRVETLEERLAERTVAPAPAPPVAGGQAPSPNGASGEDARAQQLAAELEKRLTEMEALRAQEKELRERVDQLAEARPATPQVISRTLSLDASGDVVRGGGSPDKSDIQARESTVLLLNAGHTETHRDHAVEIVAASGKVAWSATSLPRDPDNPLYTLTLPPGALPAGSYTIRVYGVTDGKREAVESYSIQVR